MLDASAVGAVLAPLGDSSEFVQVGETIDSPLPQTAAAVDNGVEENTPPDNLQILPLEDVFESDFAQLAFSFDDPDFEDTHTVEINWGDGTPTETINLAGGERFVQTTHQYLDDNPTGTPMDVNQVQITVTDSFGGQVNGQTSGQLTGPLTGPLTGSAPINVINVAPKIDSLSVTSVLDGTMSINENDTATLKLTFTDPGSLDTHTVEINWGDGTPTETINLAGGERFVQTTHQYLDDNPTDSPSDVNKVQVTITDDDTGVGMAMASVTVNNLLPTVTLNPVTMINENNSATLSGKINDVGTLDTFKLELLWGDVKSPNNSQTFMLGTTALTEAADGINWNPATREFSLSHTYLDDNPTLTASDSYVIGVTVTDDDTGVGTASEMVLVKNVAPTVTIDGEPDTSPEGTEINFTSTVTDPGTLDTFAYAWDVTIGGNLIASGASPTFSFTPPDDGLYMVMLTVADDDLGIGTDKVMISVGNVDPKLDPVADQSTLEGSLFTMTQMTFGDPGFTSAIAGTFETFTYDIVWGDGSPVETMQVPSGVTDGSPGVLTTGTIDDSHIYADDGVYTVTVTVRDDDGGSDTQKFDVTVGNVDPILAGTDSIPILKEGQEFTLAGLGVKIQDQGFDNPQNPNEQPGGSMETFVGMKVVWGDGTEDVLMVDNANRTLGGENMPTLADFVHTAHTYADNGPDTTGGKYTVEVTVRDDDGGFVTRSFEIQVDNVIPTLTLTDATLEVSEGDELDLSEMSLFGLLGTFSDPGFDNPGNIAYPSGESFETFTYSIDWGDGTLVETMLVPTTTVFGSAGVATEGTLTGKHTYADNDVDSFFTIKVTLTDDDGGTVEKMIPVRVNNVNPTLEPLIATDVNTEGETTLTLTFEDPGIESEFLESGKFPFTVLVDWGDKLGEPDLDARFVVAEVSAGPSPQTFIIVHKYLGPPDPLHPAADILLRVKIQDDDFGNSVIVDIGESNLEIVVISNPGLGAEPFRIDTTLQVPRLQFRREARSDLLLDASNSAEASLQGADLRAVSSDSQATTESILELRVIDSYEVESEGIRLKSKVLNDLPKLFIILPDNHYAIYLIRIETATERLVIEVYVRNGKVIDPSDDSEGTRDRPPTDEASRDQVLQILERTEKRPDGSMDIENIRRALEAELGTDSEILIEPVAEPDDRGAMLPPNGLLPIAAGLVATRSFGSWAEQVDRAVAQAGPKKWRKLRQHSRNNQKNR